jgi:hypothetical protein
LAARGLDAMEQALRLWEPAWLRIGGGGAAILALGLAFAPQLATGAGTIAAVWAARPLPFSDEGRVAYHAARHPHYAAIRERTAFLREPGSHPGPIYVIDVPTYYVLAERTPAIPLLAPWFHPTDRLWNGLVTALGEAQPPYVRVSDWGLAAIVDYRPSMHDAVAGIVPLLERRYARLSHDADGIWYIRRDLIQ